MQCDSMTLRFRSRHVHEGPLGQVVQIPNCGLRKPLLFPDWFLDGIHTLTPSNTGHEFWPSLDYPPSTQEMRETRPGTGYNWLTTRKSDVASVMDFLGRHREKFSMNAKQRLASEHTIDTSIYA